MGPGYIYVVDWRVETDILVIMITAITSNISHRRDLVQTSDKNIIYFLITLIRIGAGFSSAVQLCSY